MVVAGCRSGRWGPANQFDHQRNTGGLTVGIDAGGSATSMSTVRLTVSGDLTFA